MSVACQCQSPGLSFAFRLFEKIERWANKRKQPHGWCQYHKVMHTDFCQTNNCLLEKKKHEKMNGFIYNSHPPHMLHAACPCVQYKKKLRNRKSTRWIITNKMIYGSTNAERKERGELNCPPYYVFIHGQAKAKKHTQMGSHKHGTNLFPDSFNLFKVNHWSALLNPWTTERGVWWI